MIVSQHVSYEVFNFVLQDLLPCFVFLMCFEFVTVLSSGFPDTIEDPPQASGEFFARMDRAQK